MAQYNDTTSLLPKLAHILQLMRHSQGIMTPEAKQALLHATNDFKYQAKDAAANLPGGELTLSEQGGVGIRMPDQRPVGRSSWQA